MSKKNFIYGVAAIAAIACANNALAQETKIDWSKGSPRYTDEEGQNQFRIRGRYMADAYAIDADFAGTSADGTASGFGTRRFRLGVEGKTQGLNYKAEVTFKPDASLAQIEYNDVWVGYDTGSTEIIFGNNYFTAPMESLTSSLVQMTTERSMASAAFGQADRATGLVIRKYSDNWMVVGGFYGNKGEVKETGTALAGGAGTEAQYIQVRGDYAINNNKGSQLIVGAHAKVRDANNSGSISYAHAKPVQTNYGSSSYLGTPSGVLKDTVAGVEGFWTMGSLSIMGEYSQAKAETLTKDYTFGGGFVEAAYFLTGEVRAYDVKSGEIKGLKPNSPLLDGGFGAWGLVARYDNLDLEDGTHLGGKADGYSLGVLWQPVDYAMLRAMYGHTKIEGGPKGGGTVNAFTVRAQFSF